MTATGEIPHDLAYLRPDQLNNVVVSWDDRGRQVTCFCNRTLRRSIVSHFKEAHPDDWSEWVELFTTLVSSGFALKKVMRLFRAGNGPLLFSWTVIERAVRSAVEDGTLVYKPRVMKKVKSWEPESFEAARSTVWDFPRRGTWAVHKGDYRGNWPPQLVRDLILRYTEPGDLLIDAFMGGGTSLIEAWLLDRKSLGIDVSELAIQTTEGRLAGMAGLASEDPRVNLREEYRPVVIRGNALRLKSLVSKYGVSPGSARLICVHPPYVDSLKYTNRHSKDPSHSRSEDILSSDEHLCWTCVSHCGIWRGLCRVNRRCP